MYMYNVVIHVFHLPWQVVGSYRRPVLLAVLRTRQVIQAGAAAFWCTVVAAARCNPWLLWAGLTATLRHAKRSTELTGRSWAIAETASWVSPWSQRFVSCYQLQLFTSKGECVRLKMHHSCGTGARGTPLVSPVRGG